MCREDLFVTARMLCGFKDMDENFHGRLAKWVQKNLRRNKRKMMVLASRGHLKSSLLTIAGSLWFVINDPNVRILIVQASASKVKDIMSSLRQIFASDAMRHYFPELSYDAISAANLRFNESEIQVPRSGAFPDGEPTIAARGITSSVTGGHYDIHLFDDVIDQEIAQSSTELESVLRWFQNSPPLFVSPHTGIRIVVGTCWALNDLYQHIKAAGTHEVYEIGCYMDARAERLGFVGHYDPADPYSGDPLWGKRFTREALLSIRKDMMNDTFFSFQYLNIPVAEGLKRFSIDMMMYYKWNEYKKILVINRANKEKLVYVSDMSVKIFVDVSLGEKAESDEFALIVCGWHPYTSCAYFLDLFHGRIDTISQVDVVLEYAEKWSHTNPIIGIEKAGLSTLRPWFEQKMQQNGKSFTVIDLMPGGRKKSLRIEGMQPFFAGKQVWLGERMEALVSQLLGFQPRPDGSTGLAHDDIIDAAAYNVPYWRGFSQEDDEFTDEEIEDWRDEDVSECRPLYGI